MLEAVLFDWTNTLVEFTWDDELLAEGHRAALGRDDPGFTARYQKLVLGDVSHRPYTELLAELGVPDPDRFIDVEHDAWRPAHKVLSSAQALQPSPMQVMPPMRAMPSMRATPSIQRCSDASSAPMPVMLPMQVRLP